MQQMSLRDRTRRHFFSQCFVGLGNIALGGLLSNGKLTASNVLRVENPLAPKAPHFTPKVKRVIYLFMAGAPSQFETWLYRPKLGELDGQPTPDFISRGQAASPSWRDS